MASTATCAAFGAGAVVAAGVMSAFRKTPQPKNVEFTYFDIKATPGEKVRLALTLSGTSFKDNRVKFSEWSALKPKTKYGQLPILAVDEEETYQSGAMLRWAGRLGNGSLYPANDVEKVRKIEEMLGVSDDLNRAWVPALYMGMGRHTTYGYPQDWPEKTVVVKALREKFVREELPKYMGFLAAELEKTGAFLCGDKPTIADCQLLPQVAYYTQGIADHVPKDCLKDYPVVLAWIDRMMALPELKQWYSK